MKNMTPDTGLKIQIEFMEVEVGVGRTPGTELKISRRMNTAKFQLCKPHFTRLASKGTIGGKFRKDRLAHIF
jgi:hypothetical protein